MSARIWHLEENRLGRYVGRLCSIDMEAFGEAAWEESNFGLPLPSKFQLSMVALRCREPAGYLIASAYGPGYAHIHRFVVSARFRRKGVATKLLRHFETVCSKISISEVTLESVVNRLNVNSFYERSGFTRMDSPDAFQYLERRKKNQVARLYYGLSSSGNVIVYRKSLSRRVAENLGGRGYRNP